MYFYFIEIYEYVFKVKGILRCEYIIYKFLFYVFIYEFIVF